MKVGIDARAANWYRGTGIGTYTYELLNSLNRLDEINDYLIFMPQGCNSSINFKKNFNIRNIKCNKSNNFWEEVDVPNLIKDQNIEIYHVPQNGIGIPSSKQCPFVITLHDVIPYKMPSTVSDSYLKIFLKEVPKIVPLCDGIITVSNYSKKDIMKTFNFPEEKIFVTYLAAEEIYRPIDKELSKNIIRENYGISSDFILYVGGFSPRKNIVGLIQAYRLLPKDIKDKFKLVIAGKKGISYEIYKSLVEKLDLKDNVIFPGFIGIEDLPYLYNASSLFVYPSFYEGFGLPPIEAMACGIPVITSNVTSLPEIVEDSGILVDPYNVEDISDAMERVLADKKLYERLVLSGILKSASLTFENTAVKTMEAYKTILT